jgi:hypothetical protein
MRTSNALTQQEIDAFAVFAREHNLELDGAVGEANGTALGEPIVTQGFDINGQTLLSVFTQIKDRGVLVFKSQAKVNYDKALTQYCQTVHNQEMFEAWLKAQSRHMTVDGDHGYENATKVLQRMQGKEFNSQRLDLELSRCFANTTMRFIPTVDKAYLNSPHHSCSRKWDAPESTIAFTGGRSYRNDPPTPGTIEGSGKNADAYWKSKCEEGIGGTHSQRASIARMFVRNSSGGIDWQQTYSKRIQVARNS